MSSNSNPLHISSYQNNLSLTPQVDTSPSPVGSPVNKIQDLLSNHDSYPDLSSYLSQPKMCVSKLIKHSLSVKYIIAKHPQIVEYLAEHINELISIIFSDDQELANQGYMVFGHLQSTLIDSVLQTSDFHSQVIEVLKTKNHIPRILSHACNLTALSLTMSVGEFPVICDYITDFLNYIEKDPIIDFFEEITQEDITYTITQEWLVKSSFQSMVIEQINSIEVDSDDYFTSKSLQKLTNLFKLIKFSETSHQLINSFRIVEMIKAITRFKRLPYRVEDARWAALDALYCADSVDIMKSLFHTAFNVLAEPYLTVNNFRLSALNLLEKMLQNDRKLITSFQKVPLQQILLRMILQFGNNSFVLIQIEHFVQLVFKNKDLNVIYANSLIPALMYEGTKNVTMSAFSFKVIDDALTVAQKDKVLKNKRCFNSKNKRNENFKIRNIIHMSELLYINN